MQLRCILLQLHSVNGLYSRTTWVSRHQKGKPFWILLKQEMMGGNGISWTICKSFAPHRQITTPVPHHSIFMGRMLFLMPNQQCQSTKGNIPCQQPDGNKEVVIYLQLRVVGCCHGYLSGARCRFAYGPADATATYCLLLQ